MSENRSSPFTLFTRTAISRVEITSVSPFPVSADSTCAGTAVTLRLEARPDDDLGGQIVKLARSVRRKSWRLPVNVYRVEIALDRTQPNFMRPAMRFRGAIEIARVPSVLAVPRTAVYLRESGPVVWLKGHLGWSERKVSLGRSNRELVEVLAGLAEGDLVSPTDLAEKEGRPERRPGASG